MKLISLKNLKRYMSKMTIILKIILLCAVLFYGLYDYSAINYKIGTIFFGGYKKLYHINFANYFFWQAVHPPFGIAVPYANHQLSRTYFIQGNLDEAIYYAKKEIAIHPEDTATYYILGLTYGYMNDDENAISSFSSYIATDPTTWAARNDKAWLQFKIGDVDGALKTIEPFKDATGNPWIQNTLGTLYMNKKMYKEAEISYENALYAATAMSKDSWGAAYPGNDPRIYKAGRDSMIFSIKKNILLLSQTKEQNR